MPADSLRTGRCNIISSIPNRCCACFAACEGHIRYFLGLHIPFRSLNLQKEKSGFYYFWFCIYIQQLTLAMPSLDTSGFENCVDPVLTSRHLSYKTRGHVYSSCVRSAMLHASETWPLTKTNLQRLQRNDRAMIRQICSIKPEDVTRVRSSELLAKLQLEDLDLILRERRLRWFGHVARSSGAIRTAYNMQIDGKRGAGRPKQTWKKLKDCREWKLTTVDPQERSTWRSGVRYAMRAASQLPGKGPTDVDDAPAPAR